MSYKNIIFGMNETEAAANDVSFDVADGNIGNPYGESYFSESERITHVPGNTQNSITSIPTPYARMFLPDLAFREWNINRNISKDYIRAMSHCLDIFELLYKASQYDLRERGFEFKLISLRNPNDGLPLDGLAESTVNYLKALQVYRDAYNKEIAKLCQENNFNYCFDFTKLYVIKYKGMTIGGTSPFSGFFTKADTNLGEKIQIPGQRRHMLNDNSEEWCMMDGRTKDFQEFMYVLLKSTGLKYLYKNLFTAVEGCIDKNEINVLDRKDIVNAPEYAQFNMGNSPLRQLHIRNGNQLYIRPNGVDCSYLKHLLYLSNPIEFSINEDEYQQTDIAQRTFNGNFVPWISVNDILSDALYVLPYEINDNYDAVKFLDENDNIEKRRCLIPLKTQILSQRNAQNEVVGFYTIGDLYDRIKIVKRRDGIFVVTITLDTTNNGRTIIRREYGNDAVYPQGKLVQGVSMKPFGLGIYPFAYSANVRNIQKILFYNNFEYSNEPQNLHIKMWKENNGVYCAALQPEVNYNKTNKKENADFPYNTEYYQYESNDKLAFLEVNLPEGNGLIMPKLRNVDVIRTGEVLVSVDLGTSNTYVAYGYRNTATSEFEKHEICTMHNTNGGAWNELTFMNRKVNKMEAPNALDKNLADLYLKNSDRDTAPSDEYLPIQMLEFIPSVLTPDGDASYKFPIPTALNILKNNCERPQGAVDLKPLLNAAIPFAYYELGDRSADGYDQIENGNAFKWFCRRDRKGNIKTDNYYKLVFEAFVEELLFIIRCHLICEGYNLTNVKLVWSYPLSFFRTLRNDYDKTWRDKFRTYFNNNAGAVEFTNESRSPIYDCVDNFATVNNLHLLLDIGGGSSDIIGYKDMQPQFITSFGFAGNALYLNGTMNNRNANNKNIIWHYVSDLEIFRQVRSVNGISRIDLNQPLSVLMNYGFSVAPREFERIFSNDAANFFLMLHNSALIYHTAQLAHLKCGGEVPYKIYLSGNGSKLLMLNEGYRNLINKIFGYVYNRNGLSIAVENPGDVKKATVNGIIKGKGDDAYPLMTGEEAEARRVVLLGDQGTELAYEANLGGAPLIDTQRNRIENYKELVKSNVVAFVEMFYSVVYTNFRPILAKDEMLRSVEAVIGNPELNIPEGVLTDSLFFKYISLVMEDVSDKLSGQVFGN